MPTGTRKVGNFCWINVLTPRPAEARDFFSKLLGWTYTEIPFIGGHIVKVDGKEIGALFDLAGPNTPPGTPAAIGVMVKVASADATAAKAKELGGQAQPPFDIMMQGRMAVCHDPSGANVDLWEPKSSKGMDADGAHHGAPSWFETLTKDVAGDTKFYTALFGWTAQVMPMPGADYTVFSLDGEPVAGAMAVTPQMGDCPPRWNVYFTVKDADATAKLAAELGATLCVPAQDIPNVGRFCGIVSPQGVTFFTIQYTRPA